MSDYQCPHCYHRWDIPEEKEIIEYIEYTFICGDCNKPIYVTGFISYHYMSSKDPQSEEDE